MYSPLTFSHPHNKRQARKLRKLTFLPASTHQFLAKLLFDWNYTTEDALQVQRKIVAINNLAK